jgi:hypothetical protein
MNKHLLLATLLAAACDPAPPPQQYGGQRPLDAQTMRGPADGPSGRVLVITATCGSLESECRTTWAPTVDQIILGALEFRGYDTIDPTTLRKDERSRKENIVEDSSNVEHSSEDSAAGVAIIGLIPIAGGGKESHHSVTVSHSTHKTIILEGANFEDLRLEDKKKLMDMAGAQTVATSRVVIGANYGMWTHAQNVEVIVKLADAATGTMRWSTRCTASSTDNATVELAIENAARCAASAFTLNQ